MWKRVCQWLEKNEGLIFLIILTIILRIPSLYEPHWYGDEGIYLVMGQALRKGLVFYKDIHDNKPPLLYLLGAIAGNVFWFRTILMLWFGITTAIFFRLMQMLLPKNKKSWYLSTLVLILGTTMLEGNVANAEIFMIGPIIAGMLMALQKTQNRKKQLIIGLLFSMAFLFKVPAVFDFAALLLWWVIWKNKQLKYSLLGFSIPIGVTLIYYRLAGGLERYVRSALLQNIGYLSSWENSQSGLLIRGGILIVMLSLFYAIDRKFRLSTKVKLVIVWFLMALFGALLSERPYPHYLIQPMVPGAILLSYFVFGKRKILKSIILILVLLAGINYYQIKFWHYPVFAYYQNFGKYVLGRKNKEEYNSFFDWRVNQTYKVAEYLRKKTFPDEKIFIWGDEPYIYALAKKLPIGKYTVAYHVVDFNGYKETMETWDKYKPRMVIVMEYEKRQFPEMEARLKNDYLLIKKIDQALVYKRINGKK